MWRATLAKAAASFENFKSDDASARKLCTVTQILLAVTVSEYANLTMVESAMTGTDNAQQNPQNLIFSCSKTISTRQTRAKFVPSAQVYLAVNTCFRLICVLDEDSYSVLNCHSKVRKSEPKRSAHSVNA